jgi:hypothetical protein
VEQLGSGTVSPRRTVPVWVGANALVEPFAQFGTRGMTGSGSRRVRTRARTGSYNTGFRILERKKKKPYGDSVVTKILEIYLPNRILVGIFRPDCTDKISISMICHDFNQKPVRDRYLLLL